MNILLIVESYKPLIGGTVSYAEKIAYYSAKKHNVILVFPNTERVIYTENNIVHIGLDIHQKELKITRSLHYDFANEVNRNLESLIFDFNIELVHVLAGWFLHEKLNTRLLKEKNIKSVITVHNLPPKECSNSWNGDRFISLLIDKLRTSYVRIETLYRFMINKFDLYIVPSEDVKSAITQFFPDINIQVLPHGIDERVFQKANRKTELRTDYELLILTVGGFVPHKNQLLIARVARELNLSGVNFKWTLVGPIRNRQYYESVCRFLKNNDLESNVKLRHDMSQDDLYALYSSTDIYVQPSKEEGFCFTALDAAAFSLPIVGTDVGEIKALVDLTSGVLVNSTVLEIKNAILKLSKNKFLIDAERKKMILDYYCWDRIINDLLGAYSSLCESVFKGSGK